MEWVFSGIGTHIIVIVITFTLGMLGGGVSGYIIGTRKILCQKADNDAQQKQQVVVDDEKSTTTENKARLNSTTNLSQQAKDNAKQTQIIEYK